ncbi:WD40-repeat-containing domain protein [Suillus occidentalis]|nr:WD40-repeat-containing domain protein [Suillus occidentalis]
MSNLISCVSWVKRGVSAHQPSKYVLDEKELERVSALARIELEDARIEIERAHNAAKSMGKGAEGAEADDADEDGDEDAWVDEEDASMEVDVGVQPELPAKGDDLAQYKLDEYDEDDVKEDGMGPFSNIKGLTFYRDDQDDPYITLKDDAEDDERSELEVLLTDNLLVAAKTEDDVSQLEIYIYDESQDNLYVHHDLMLPNFPLCLEWLDFPPTSSEMQSDTQPKFGNYIAVGTLDPEIEIWSLDVMESMYPDMILGRPDKTAAHVPVPAGTGKKKRKKTKHRPSSDAYHVDAVLGLSWNRTHRHMLASASADRTVKLWDLSRPIVDGEGAIRSFGVHKDKVQAVQWNEKEPTVLLSGSYDRTI